MTGCGMKDIANALEQKPAPNFNEETGHFCLSQQLQITASIL